jgi:hypothetical protein
MQQVVPCETPLTNFKTAGAHSDLDWNERCMGLGFFALSQLSVLPSSVSILIEVAAGTSIASFRKRL